MSLIISVSHPIRLGEEVGEAIEPVFGTGIFNSNGLFWQTRHESLNTN